MEIEAVIENVSPAISLKNILGLPVIVRTVKALLAAGCRKVVIQTDEPEHFKTLFDPFTPSTLLRTGLPSPSHVRRSLGEGGRGEGGGEGDPVGKVEFISRTQVVKPGAIILSGNMHYDPDLIRLMVAVPSPLLVRRSLGEGGMGEGEGEGDLWQQKLDKPSSFKLAERKLFENIRRKTEGWVAPHINKPISFFITKYLVRTKITPNQITLVNFLVAGAAFFFLVKTDYASRFMGALLMYISSIVDGCDGEVARLKLMTSKVGAWFDTIADDFSNNLFLLSLALGLYSLAHDNHYLVFGFASLIMSLGVTAVIYHQLLTRVSTGNAKDFTLAWEGEQKKRWSDKIRPLLKRDFFIAVIFVFVVLDLREIVFWIAFGATAVTFVLYSYSLILSLLFPPPSTGGG